MSDKRQDLIDYVITQMEGITDFESVGDFETNWHAEELPALSVFDSVAQHQLANNEPEADSQRNALSLSFQIFVKSGTRAEDVRALMKKVRDVVAQNRRWNNLAAWTKPVTSSITVERTNPESTNFEIIGANLEYEVTLLSNAFDF